MTTTTTTTTPKTKTILFLGATGGVALATLRRALAAGHTCIALCRTPAKLTACFPDNTPPANLRLVQGDAHDANGPVAVVDAIVFSIGARPTLRGISDPHVCEAGMRALLDALRRCRARANSNSTWTPLAWWSLLLHTAHEDKRAMERLVMDTTATTTTRTRRSSARGEEEEEPQAEEGDGPEDNDRPLVDWTLVRGSLYTDGPATEGRVRVGMEDPVRGVVHSRAVGYTISREDVGKWVWENCLCADDGKWVGKAATITY
ncbi:2dcf89d7-91ec-483d-9f83-1682e05b2ff0 [Thermothielavioides terrestris]|uniref:2dcf89d7-91ec-483d-9f83-1682e05b2ff0 n=1 Tax=Thermothielavioides terrestris TaxID=2587410 RepID=A0A446BUX1_9PEZI|nr:2dcf89d7-91ec-483d-9f83-1682e05b2ff0 [Thermothielavioides terrestris]